MQEPQKNSKIKYFLRRTARYRTLLFTISLITLTFLLARSDTVLKNNRILPIKEVQLEAIDGRDLEYISEGSISESLKFAKENNYISLNSRELSAKIKGESPFAKDLIITKSLPGNVIISILERQPILGLDIASYGCVVIDKVGFVLEKQELNSEEEAENADCKDTFEVYKIPTLSMSDTKVSFVINEQSSFYIVEDLYKILLTTSHYSLETLEMTLEDNVLVAKTTGERELLFSINQPVQEQLKRFISVMGQLSADSIEFTRIDLRYRRPVIRQK